jgi:hypothetical protein
MLCAIERATRQKIEPLELPSTETVNNKRIADFKQRISDTLAAGELDFMQGLVEQYQHDVKPGNIAGAIAHEAGLDCRHIGHIDIHTEFSLVDLPIGMPKDVFQDLRRAWVCGQRLDISRLERPKRKKRGGQMESKGTKSG